MVSFYQEKRLRVNMGLKKLREKVKEQQEKVGEKVCFLNQSNCATMISWRLGLLKESSLLIIHSCFNIDSILET